MPRDTPIDYSYWELHSMAAGTGGNVDLTLGTAAPNPSGPRAKRTVILQALVLAARAYHYRAENAPDNFAACDAENRMLEAAGVFESLTGEPLLREA